MGQLQQFIVQFSDPELDKNLLSSMWDRYLENKETKEMVWNKLVKIATSATGIPFSIFTTMMCQHFGKLKFLESTLELLQQFKLQMISSSDVFTIFPGYGSKFSLKCIRCGKCVTYPESIGWTLSIAPYAILSHLDIMLSDKNENDLSNQLETLPILFTSHKNYDMSFASFLDSVKTGRDSVYANDTDFKVNCGCVVQQNRAGEFLFCEAVKGDVLLSDADLRKNAKNTISLLKVLFEDPS